MMPVVMTVMTVVKITIVLKSVSIIMEFRLGIDSRLSRNVDIQKMREIRMYDAI